MKNVRFIAGPRSGSYVNPRLAGSHHSAGARPGWVEAGAALFVIAVLAGFARLIAA